MDVVILTPTDARRREGTSEPRSAFGKGRIEQRHLFHVGRLKTERPLLGAIARHGAVRRARSRDKFGPPSSYFLPQVPKNPRWDPAYCLARDLNLM